MTNAYSSVRQPWANSSSASLLSLLIQAPSQFQFKNLSFPMAQVIADQGWTLLLGSAFEDQFRLYSPSGTRHPFCYRCIGVVLQKLSDSSYCYHKLEQLYARADLSQPLHRKSVAMAVGLAANSHLETVLELLRKVFAQQKRKLRPFLGFLGFGSASKPEVERHFAALALMYGYTAFYAPPTALQGRIDALVGTGYFAELLKVDTWPAKYAVITAIDLLARSVQGAADRGVPFPLKKKEDLLTHVMMLMAGSGWASELLEIQVRTASGRLTLRKSCVFIGYEILLERNQRKNLNQKLEADPNPNCRSAREKFPTAAVL